MKPKKPRPTLGGNPNLIRGSAHRESPRRWHGSSSRLSQAMEDHLFLELTRGPASMDALDLALGREKDHRRHDAISVWLAEPKSLKGLVIGIGEDRKLQPQSTHHASIGAGVRSGETKNRPTLALYFMQTRREHVKLAL